MNTFYKVLLLILTLGSLATAQQLQLPNPGLPTVLEAREALPCTAPSGIACTTSLYATGVNRTNDPVVMGVPIADSDAINCGSACTLNANAPNINLRLQNSSGTQLDAQFKVLANWPSGNVKWVLVTALASPLANNVDTTNILCKTGTTTAGITCGGSGGNFPASLMATDNNNCSTTATGFICVNTGTTKFVIRKANFDVLDGATSGAHAFLASGSNGIVVNGPAADGTSTSCGTCTTAYTSANDANSTAVIEENGPLRVVIKAEGNLMNGTETYMRHRTRLYFYLNKNTATITVALRNADEGASNSFASAYKGHASWTIELKPVLGTGPAWSFGTDTSTPATGTFTGTESAYLYQAYSNSEESNIAWTARPACPAEDCTVSPILRTGLAGAWTYLQDGYEIVYNGSPLAGYPKAHTAYPQGWADLTDSSGAGIQVGVHYLSAYWPKSITLTSSLIRIGLNPDQTLWTGGNSQAYYQPWPAYHMETVYLNFHPAALPSEANTFLSEQYYLIGRAMASDGKNPVIYYNGTTDATSGQFALLYPLVSQAEQDAFWLNIQNLPVCTTGGQTNCNPAKTSKWLFSAAVHDIAANIFHMWGWRASGGSNQHEKNWGYIVNRWLERAHTSAYLYASQFYKYEMETALPHSDVAAAGDNTCNAFAPNFHFRCASQTYLDTLGFPGLVTSTNAGTATREWIVGQPEQDFEHSHWYGLTHYYFLTGDMFAYETMLQGGLDIYSNTQPNQQKGLNGSDNGRSIGHFMAGVARTYGWVKDVGDPTSEASNVLTVGQQFLNNRVVTADYCPSTTQGAWPGPCRLTINVGTETSGVSRTRGVLGQFNNGSGDNNGGGDTNCPMLSGVGNQPCAKPWMNSLALEGLWETYQLFGTTGLNNISVSPTLLFDLMDGEGNWADHEAFVLGATGTYTDTDMSYDVLLNGITPMSYGTSPPAQYEYNYWLLGQYQGLLTAAQQERFVQTYIYIASQASFNPDNIDDHDMFMSSNPIYIIDHPSANTLSSIVLPTSTVPSPCTGVTSCVVNWTPPTPPQGQNIQSYRMKDFTSKTFTEWVGFDPKTFSFSATAPGCGPECSGNATTTVPWFAGTEVTPAPASNQSSFTVTGLTPANTYNFSLKATFGVGGGGGGGQKQITSVQR